MLQFTNHEPYAVRGGARQFWGDEVEDVVEDEDEDDVAVAVAVTAVESINIFQGKGYLKKKGQRKRRGKGSRENIQEGRTNVLVIAKDGVLPPIYPLHSTFFFSPFP
jgi:hypothetical protein